MNGRPAGAASAGPGEYGLSGFEDVVEIGRGGFGTVYRAVEVALGRAVAVKIVSSSLDTAARERFTREGLAMSRLSDHPNVVPVYTVGVTSGGWPYLVMPLVPRGSVAALLDTRGPLSWQESVRTAIRLAGALETAHRAGVVHRDIKPANILLSEYGEPLLADFGIARVSGGFETATAQVTGSLAYAAPEVLDGKPPSVASDIYSLGSTLFTLLAGHPPFELSEDEAQMSLYLRIARDPVPDLRRLGVPGEVCRAVERATAKSPGDRPASAEEFGVLLQDAQRSARETVTEMAVAEPGALAATPGPTWSTAVTVTHRGRSGVPSRARDGGGAAQHDRKGPQRRLVAAAVVAVMATVAAIVASVAALSGGPGGPPAASTTSRPPTTDATPGGTPLVLTPTAVPVHVRVVANTAAEVRIDGQAGQRLVGRVHLAARPARGVPVALLIGASPLEEKSITDFDTVIEPVQLAARATYVFRIGPSSSPLDATVELAIAPDDVLVSTTIGGGPVRVSLTQPQQRALVSFEGRSGQQIRVSWTWSGPTPSYTSLTLAGPGGSVLAGWSALSSGSSPIVRLVATGSYSVGVSIDADVPGSGDVDVSAT